MTLSPLAVSAIPLPVDWSFRLVHMPEPQGPEEAYLASFPEAWLGRDFPGTVPGCVHTDLLALGEIPDPYVDRHERDLRWIGHGDWHYRTEVDVAASVLRADCVELCFEGLDTVADVVVNDQLVGRSRNMHVRHRFAVRDVLRPGANRVEVRFASPTRYAREMERRLGARAHLGGAAGGSNEPFNMIRKMACNFGWDWGPEVTTVGIWRPARLEAWSVARLGDVRPLVTACDSEVAVVEVHAPVRTAGARDVAGLRLRAVLVSPEGGEVAVVEAAAGLSEPVVLKVDRPQRWWPRGYGDQPLYRLRVDLLAEGGQVLDGREHRVGLRWVELNVKPEASGWGGRGDVPAGLSRGEPFELRVNDTAVFCKGANWIPDDCFLHRVTPERYRERIVQAAEAHMNMLRVWGGGVYEDRAFYETCDELGMLVWQDFLFACACYPEEPPLWEEVELEVADNVARLCVHPSLVLWNGCNENIWGTFEWDKFREVREAGRQSWGLGYYLKLIPSILGQLDPTRPYWPASPYSGSMDRHPNANEYGNRHIWDVWNGDGDYANYLTHFPRFASEFGFQGPPTWPTLSRAIPADQRGWFSDAVQHHNKQVGGQRIGRERLADRFGLTEVFEHQWFLASVNQARALRTGCEWFRALWPWCSGALYWQLNDCWPVFSWAGIDGDGRPKLAWYATREFFRPRLITVMPAAVVPKDAVPQALAVYLHNDTASDWRGTACVRRYHHDATYDAQANLPFAVPPRGAVRLDLPIALSAAATDPYTFIMAEASGSADDRDASPNRAWWFGGTDVDRALPPPVLETSVTRLDDAQSFAVDVTAKSLVRELCLLADRLDPQARVDRQLVNLLPGESVRFVVRGVSRLDAADVSDPRVLTSVHRDLWAG